MRMNKDSITNLIPELRFPEFQNAGEWEDIKFGELCKFTRGPFGGALKKEIFTKDGYAVYEQSHAIYEKFDSFRYYITVDKFNELKRFAVLPNDIIMSCSGTMGKFAIVPKDSKQGVINQALLKLTVLKGSDLKFIKMTLELPSNQEKLLSQSAGGAIKNVVSVDQIKEINLYIPKLAEQQKIADCLSSLDELIAANIEKLDALKSHKKGLMQLLFPAEGETIPQLRFPEFKNDGEWERKKLGAISDVRDGTHDSPQFYTNGIPLVTSKNLLTNGTLDLRNTNLISEQDYENINKRSKVEAGDILMGMIGTIGNPVMVSDIGYAIKNVALIKQQHELLNCYLVNLLNSEYIKNKFNRLNTGNTQKFISLSLIRNLEVILPKNIEEQKKIADCLSSLDELISAQSQKIETLKQHKKGLMQGLFPKNIEGING